MTQLWPFEDAENTAVFTTRQVLEGEAPILLVTHDKDDGAWQFHPLEMPRKEDARVIALSEALELDPSVRDLANLQPGWVAVRGNVGGPWKSRPKGLACRVVEYGFGEPMIITIDEEPPIPPMPFDFLKNWTWTFIGTPILPKAATR